METSVEVLRRQARLLAALLDQAQRAVCTGDWRGAGEALAALGERLQQRIELAENSVFPWVERQVRDPKFLPIARLHLQHTSLIEGTANAISAVSQRRRDLTTSTLGGLKTLLEAHVAEEEQVLWPIAAGQLRA